jgi:hypothetical protein
MSSADVLLAGSVASANNRPLAVAIVGEASSALAVTGGGGNATASAVTRVPVNVANVTLKALNASRKALTIYNNSATANLFVKLGAGAAIGVGAESFTIRMVPLSYYEVPGPNGLYTGIVDGIWDAADAGGEALITETT